MKLLIKIIKFSFASIVILFLTIVLFVFIDYLLSFVLESPPLDNFLQNKKIRYSPREVNENDFFNFDHNSKCPEVLSRNDYCYSKIELFDYKNVKYEYKRDYNAYNFEYIPLKENANRFVFISGDSNVFGYGLNNQATLGSNLSRRLPSHNVYIQARNAAAIHYSIFYLNKLDDEMIKERNGDYIYFHINSHIQRSTGSINRCCIPNGPIYKKIDNKYKFLGLYENDIYLDRIFQEYIFNSNILRLVNFNFDKFSFYNKSKIREYCDLVKELKRVVKKKLNARFHFIYHPASIEIDKDKREYLAKCLMEDEIVPNYKLMNLLNDISRKYLLPDGHPNKEGNNLISKKIVEDIILER